MTKKERNSRRKMIAKRANNLRRITTRRSDLVPDEDAEEPDLVELLSSEVIR